jgi:hypothetical protein
MPYVPQPKGGNQRTGPLPLHPMTVGDVLDGAFKLFKANARTVLLISAAFYLPIELLFGFLSRHYLDTTAGLTFFGPSSSSSSTADPSVAAVLLIVFGGLAVRYLVLQLVTGAISLVVAESYLGGELAPGDAVRATLRKWPALLVAYLLVHVIELFGAVFCLVPGLLFMSLYFRAVPAIVVEDLGPIEGMRRSWRLGRSRLWPTIGIVLLAWIVSGILGFAVSAVPTFVGGALGNERAGWVLTAVGQVLNQMIAQPFVAIVATLLYFDARIRVEGFDLAILAQGLERNAAAR